MKALVTGNAGFLGRHFAAELRARGWTVSGCDVRPRPGDVASNALDQFRDNQVAYDLVVHCAAVEPHRAAIDGQPMHLAQNLRLDAGLFEWAVRTGQRRVLYLSSSAAYPVVLQDGRSWRHNLRLAEDEIDLLGADDVAGHNHVPPTPDAGYGWCKLTGERMAADARRAGLPVTVVRPFSGYAGDQDDRWPFGAFVARARRREDPFVVWGDGSQVRDWIHVSDLVAGALAVVESGTDEPVNLCTGVGTSMTDLVQLVCAEVGYQPAIEYRRDQPAGVAYRVGNPERMHGYWTAKVDIEEGVRRALA